VLVESYFKTSTPFSLCDLSQGLAKHCYAISMPLVPAKRADAEAGEAVVEEEAEPRPAFVRCSSAPPWARSHGCAAEGRPGHTVGVHFLN
jgi:hypothetical protein